MNISLVAENLLNVKPSELTQTFYRISKIIGSSNYSLINLINKYVGVTIKFGAEKLSQQMHLASLGMFVNVFDLNDAIIEFNQVIQDIIDASVAQAAAEDEAEKKGLSTPVIAGIAFGCIFVVFIAVVVGLSFHIYFRKEKTQLLLPDEDNAIP